MKQLTIVALLIALSAIGVQVNAEDDRATAVRDALQQTLVRLELTDEQIDQVEPIFRESTRARQDILSKYGMDPESRKTAARKPGLRKMMAMRNEMTAVRDVTLAKLEPILSDEQLEEFKVIQEERRAEMRKRMRR